MNTIIIGGGAAGSYAAVFSARKGDTVTIIEPNGRIGRKLGITGKGRCNITNNCDFETLMKNIAKNPSFLYSAFARFDQGSCMSFFEELGVPLKTERGGRVFPVSDKAQDIVKALEKELKRLDVKILPEKAVEITAKENTVNGVKTDKGFYKADKVILATGGLSYPATGSRGDGYRLAEGLGHTVTELKPALVPLETKDPCPAAAGLNLKNVSLSLFDEKSGKKVYSELGEMTFESYGIGGPLVLTASTIMERGDGYKAVVDLKPALDMEKLDKRLLREIGGESERSSHNMKPTNSPQKAKTAQDVARTLLPSQLVQPILKAAGIGEEKRAAEISKADRKALCSALKN
ncbi:MAG: aminoacetone oxidase family FAD-binding enzyme, partial [Ruminiclostridium sp.]|nr:aminoacetone oxidase family FAD-binding enzyme [Ruminiclostridium sp.]